MKKGVIVILIGFVLVIVGALGYFFRDRLNKKPAGLEINTTPAATVMLNGKNVGTTPYKNNTLNAGSYTIQLVPDSTTGFTSWETKLELSPLVSTVINRTFAAAESDTSGSVLQFAKEPGGKTYISIISDPDAVNLNLDGKPSGFTPMTKVEVGPGSHSIALSSPGYKSQDMSVNTLSGYNLILNVKLAADLIALSASPVVSSSATPSASLAPSPSSSPLVASSSASPAVSKPYVIVEETGTGWLRVRKEPSSTADELGKANTGEKLKYLGESTETGWHKVEFEKSIGWVSGKYTQLVK
jgi:hypothetical protein